jgi:hypothetical protein
VYRQPGLTVIDEPAGFGMTAVNSGQTSAVSSGSTSDGWIGLSGGTLNVLSGGVISAEI